MIDRAIREYMPFIATENLMMEGVRRGGDRQQLHEIVRVCSMEATARMKEGKDPGLTELLAMRPEFGMTAQEIEALLDPSLYTGRCAEQVERYLKELEPLLAQADVKDNSGGITI